MRRNDSEIDSETEAGKKRRPSRLRRAGFGCALLLSLVLSALVLLRLGLASPSLRQAVLARAATALHGATGLWAEAEDFHLELMAGRIELRKLRLTAAGPAAAGETPALLFAERLLAEVELRSLSRRRPVVRLLRLEDARVDLGAPLPEAREAEEDGSAPDFELHRLEIASATLLAPPPAPDSWLLGWWVEGIDAEGSYLEQEAGLAVSQGTLRAEIEGQEPFLARLQGSLHGPASGPFELQDLEARGEGLELAASGRVGTGADDPFVARFLLEAEPGRILPSVTPGGFVTARGELDLRRWTGDARLEARELPITLLEPWLGTEAIEAMGLASSELALEADLQADEGEGASLPIRAEATFRWQRPDAATQGAEAAAEILRGSLRAELGRKPGSDLPDPATLAGTLDLAARALPAETAAPWIPPELFGKARAAGTRLDLDAELDLDPAGALAGDLELRWRRGARRLLEAELAATSPRFEAPTRLAFEAALLPDAAGTRKLAGALVAPSRQELARPSGDETDTLAGRLTVSRLEEARLRLVLPELEAALATLAEEWPGLLPAERPELPGSLTAGAELRGTLSSPRAEVEGQWSLAQGEDLAFTAAGDLVPVEGRLVVETSGVELARLRAGAEGRLQGTVRIAGDLETYEGEASLRLEGLDIASLDTASRDTASRDTASRDTASRDTASSVPGLAGRLDLDLDLDLASRGRPETLAGRLEADLRELASGEAGILLDRGRLAARLEGNEISIEELQGRRRELEFTGTGSVRLARDLIAMSRPAEETPAAAEDGEAAEEATPLLEAFELSLELTHPPQLRRAELGTSFADGIVRVELAEIDSDGGTGRVEAFLPLGSLAAVPELAETLEPLPVAKAAGPIRLDFAFGGLDSETLLPLLGPAERDERVRGNLSGELTVDLARPALAEGEILVADLDIENAEHRLQVEDALRFTLGGGRLRLDPANVLTDGKIATLRAETELAPEWSWRRPAGELFRHLDARAEGVLEAALLNPYLPTGRARGPLQVQAELSGPLEALRGEMSVSGPGLEAYSADPYPTRLEGLEAELEIVDSLVLIHSARSLLNEGPLELEGTLGADGDLDLHAQFRDVRYRVDYGLNLVAGGDLRLKLPPEGRGSLGGEVEIARGLLRRDLNLESELFETLFAPVPIAAAAPADTLEQIDLDLEVSLRDGVRVRNNLADLTIGWQPLEVRGTIAQPLAKGRLEARSGGLLYLPGQSLRVDRGSLTLPGIPGAEPELDVSTTSSLENPSIGTGRRASAFDSASRGIGGGKAEAAPDYEGMEESLGSYYGGRLAESILGGRFSARPVYIFGETDPGARLTLSRDLSLNAAIAVSINLRESGERTYILDLHDFRLLPSFSSKIFTVEARNPTEPGDRGLTFEQTLELGGPRAERERPRIARIRIEGPPELPIRKLKRQSTQTRGDPLTEDSTYDLELDLADSLRRLGFPGATVETGAEAAPEAPLEHTLWAKIDLGPAVEIVFTGEELPRRGRRLVRELYMTGFFEEAALEDMRERAEQVLRAEGFLAPEVEVSVEPLDPARPEGDRRIVVASSGGRRVKIGELEVQGAPEPVPEALEESYATLPSRVELAIGGEEARAALLRSLAALGYPEAEVAELALSEDGGTLRLAIEPGEPQILRRIEIAGVDETEAEALRKKLDLAAGDLARTRRIASASYRLEQALEAQGYAEARSRPVLSPLDEGGWGVTFEIERGPVYKIRDVLITGLTRTREQKVRATTGLTAGETFLERELALARGRLFSLGTFSKVEPEAELDEDGDAVVRLDLDEAARWQVSYGIRWSTEESTAVLVDVVDRNAFRRAVTLGARVLFKNDDESLILLARLPRLFGSPVSLEVFGEDRRKIEDGFLDERQEATLQLSVPFGPHANGRLYGRFREQVLREIDPDPFFPLNETIKSPLVGLQWIYDDRDDIWKPRGGLLASVDLSASDESIGSDFAYVRFLGKLALFRPIGKIGSRELIWAQAYQVGWARPLRGQVLLRSDRFFTGGEFSVRGYPEDEIGPFEELGQLLRPAGGESLFVMNQELRFPVWGLLSALVFFDAGNVWEDRSFEADLFESVGLGLRADTPLGLLRLDLAHPFDAAPGDRELQIYFGFGNTF